MNLVHATLLPRHHAYHLQPTNYYQSSTVHTSIPSSQHHTISETLLTTEEHMRILDFPLLSSPPYNKCSVRTFRCSQKIGRQLGPAIPILLAAQLAALEDMITAAKTMHVAQMATIVRARLRTLIDAFNTARPILVTNPCHLSFSNLHDSVFISHSLASDK